MNEWQRRQFEREVESCVNSPRWAIFFVTLTADSADPVQLGSTPEVRQAGLFDPNHVRAFMRELDACVSSNRWFVAFATLDEKGWLETQVRCSNVPKDELVHAALEHLMLAAIGQGDAWTRNFPRRDDLHRAFARGAWEALENRRVLKRGQQRATPAGMMPMPIMETVENMFGPARTHVTKCPRCQQPHDILQDCELGARRR